jgi:hypothetical protein
MTGARRQQKAKGRQLIAAAAVTLVATLAGSPARFPADAATTGRIVTDPLTGLALSGFDPVAYFTDGTPRLGEGAHELAYGGAIWRFRNEGNRAAFARDPQVYAPRFGGHDPIALARGVAVPGHPLIWWVSGERLYLFGKPESRAEFAADAEHAIAVAEHHWGEVARTLVP